MGPAIGILLGCLLLALGVGIWAIVKAAGVKGAYQDYDPEEAEGFKIFMGLNPMIWLLLAFILLGLGIVFSIGSYNEKDATLVGMAVCALSASGFCFYGLYESNKF
jgi:hypothetical protein